MPTNIFILINAGWLVRMCIKLLMCIAPQYNKGYPLLYCGVTLQHVHSGIGMLWACWLWHTDFLSRRVAYTVHTSYLFTLSDTVLGRRVSLRVWSRTQITLALRDYMVLISVNAVLRLLKRSMCVRGRTHSVICRYLPVWRRATIALRAIVARTLYSPNAPHFTLVKEALIEIGCVVTSLVVGCHARALWPNGAS